MIRTHIVRPIKTKVHESSSGLGEIVLKSPDYGYDVVLKRLGNKLREAGELYIKSDGQSRIGGEPLTQVTPRVFDHNDTPLVPNVWTESSQSEIYPKRQGALLPRSFYKPFKYKYSFDNEDWYGQSSKNAISYKHLAFEDKSANYNQKLANPRFFSYSGNLLLAGEMIESGVQVVKLFVQNEQSGRFELVKSFDEVPVDQSRDRDVLITAQLGSPDMCEFEGKLVLIYRSTERFSGGGRNNIVTWTTGPSLSEWESYVTRVDETFGPDYDIQDWTLETGLPTIYAGDVGFRLRCAAGPNAIQVVFMGRKTVTTIRGDLEGGPIPYVKKEIQTMTSYDGGISFVINRQELSPLERVSDGSMYRAVNPFLGLTSLFEISESTRLDENEDLVLEEVDFFDVNFGLYYDEGMGSFVVIKAGDTRGLGRKNNSTYGERRGVIDNALNLIGIKTTPGSYSYWEPCFVFDLRSSNVAQFGTRFYSPQAGVNLNIRICDVDIEPGGNINTLFLLLKTFDSRSLLENTSAIGFYEEPFGNVIHTYTEFSFINRRVYKKGHFNSPYVGVGSDGFGEYIFSMAPLNPNFTGLLTFGYFPWDITSEPERSLVTMYSLTATSHRGQLITSAKVRVPGTGSGLLSCYGVVGEVTTTPDLMDYGLNYTSYIQSIQDFGFGIISQVRYDYSERQNEDGMWNRFYSDTVTPTYAYSRDGHVGAFFSPSASDTSRVRFRARLIDRSTGDDLDVSFIPSIILRIYYDGRFGVDMVPGSTSGSEIPLRIRLRDSDESPTIVYGSTPIDITEPFEILLDKSMVRLPSQSGGPEWKISVWLRTPSSSGWVKDIEKFVSSSPGGRWLDLGATAVSSANYRIAIGDVQYGSANHFEPLFTNLRGHHPTGYKDSFNTPGYNGGWIESYSSEIELEDGSLIEIVSRGGRPSVSGDRFILEGVGHSNSLVSLEDGFTSRVYTFLQTSESETSSEVVSFRNVHRHLADSVSLFNLHGCHQIVVRAVDFYGETYESTRYTRVFDVPYELEVVPTEISPRVIRFEGDLVTNELSGKSLFVRDRQTGDVESQYNIIQNGRDSIILDRELPYYLEVNDKEFFVTKDSVIFDIPSSETTHLTVEFVYPSDRHRAYVGEVVFGRRVDMSEDITEFSESYESNFEVLESEFGLLFPTMVGGGNYLSSGELGLTLIDPRERDRVFNLFNSIYKDRLPFPIEIFYERNKRVELASLSGDWSMIPSERQFEMSIPIVMQRWGEPDVDSIRGVIEVDLRVSKREAFVSEYVEFTLDVYNPAGYDLEFLWDLGGGNTTVTTSPYLVSNFSEPGSILVQVQITGGGYTIHRQIEIEVKEGV